MTLTINTIKPEIPTADDVESKVSETIEEILKKLSEIAEDLAPKKTGLLASSHVYSVSGSTGELTNTVDYLQYVIFGRGWVFPVTKKALYWEELDHPVAYARPAKANDYLSAAVDSLDVEPIIEDVFINWLQK